MYQIMNQRLKKIFRSIFARREKTIPITIVGLVTVVSFSTLFLPATAHASLASFLGLDSLGQLIDTALATIAYFVMTICAWVLGLVGLAFDAVLNFTVVNMKTNLTGIKIINSGWADIRDIGNLIFIFMAIYLGVQEIIGLNAGKIKILVRNLIIVGLLVNFSLFFTQLLIDASNILTISFYNLVLHIVSTTNDSFTTVFSQRLGLNTVYKIALPKTGAINALANLGFFQIIVVGIGSSLFFLVTAVTFLFAGALFVIRFVIFIFLMILSPIAFLFSVLPGKLQSISQTWWETLSGQLIFAPLYMILILLVALVINSGGINVSDLSSALTSEATGQAITTKAAISAGNNPLAANNLKNIPIGTCSSNDSSHCSIIYQIFFFVLIIVLMNAAMILSMNWASKGSGISSKAVGWVGGKAKATMGAINRAPLRTAQGTAGMTGRLAASQGGKFGRATLGRTAAFLGSDESKIGAALGRGTASNNWVVNKASSLARGGLKRTAEGSYDVRQSKTIQGLASKTGINVGKAQEGGYHAHLEREAADMEKKIKAGGGPTRQTAEKLRASRSSVSEKKLALSAVLTKEKDILEAEARGEDVKDKRKQFNEEKEKAQNEIRKAKAAVKTAEKTRDAEKNNQQAIFISNQQKHAGILSVITGKHKAAYKKVAENFTDKAKTTDKDKKAKEEEQMNDLGDKLHVAISSGNSGDIKKIVGDIVPGNISKLPKDLKDLIVKNKDAYDALGENLQKSFKKQLSRNDLEKVLEHEGGVNASHQS